MKKCTKCNEIKDLTQFYKNKTCKNGLSTQCKSCYINSNKQYVRDNGYKSNKPKDKNKISIYNKEYYKNHRGKYCKTRIINDLNHSEKNKIFVKKWRQNNPSKTPMYSAKRRASKLQATPKWLTKDHYKLIEMQYQLASYLTECTGILWTVDHIIPLQGKNVRGLHVPWNLRVITEHENCSKNNKT
jgi:hypothetical protein